MLPRLYVLADNEGRLVGKFSDAACAMLRVKHCLMIDYHPQASGQTWRFIKTIVKRLRRYVEKHERDWEIYLQPLTYG